MHSLAAHYGIAVKRHIYYGTVVTPVTSDPALVQDKGSCSLRIKLTVHTGNAFVSNNQPQSPHVTSRRFSRRSSCDKDPSEWILQSHWDNDMVELV